MSDKKKETIQLLCLISNKCFQAEGLIRHVFPELNTVDLSRINRKTKRKFANEEIDYVYSLIYELSSMFTQ